MSESAKWYVVHTYSGYENKVMTNLQNSVENRKLHDLILDVRVPFETVTEIKESKGTQVEKEVKRKLFPGYVLVKMVMTDESWYVVRNIRGVTGFVGPSSKPVPLSEEEVARLDVEIHSTEVSYKVGDSVKINAGPLSGYTGIVEEINIEADSVRVTVSMFGRETPAELKLNQVSI